MEESLFTEYPEFLKYLKATLLIDYMTHIPKDLKNRLEKDYEDLLGSQNNNLHRLLDLGRIFLNNECIQLYD